MSVWLMAMVAAVSAVIAPTQAMSVSAHGDATWSTGLSRTSR